MCTQLYGKLSAAPIPNFYGYEGDVGLGRTRLSIRSDSAFHLGKWSKTRIFRNFELRRIRRAFCPAPGKRLF